MRERDVESYLTTRAKALGGDVRKVRWLGRRGAPDRLVLLQGLHFYVELKRPGEAVTVQQQREHVRLRRAGLAVYVASTHKEVDDVFAHALFLNAIGVSYA